jgi:cytoplasmic iron level regulating protein YaaA (DUF328/UPF0246 family)
MSKLIAVISPAKLLDEKTHHDKLPFSQLEFQEEAAYLVSKLRKKSSKSLGEMMDLSAALSDENKRRYMEWELPFTPENAFHAILMFKGDVYRGMQAETFSQKEMQFAQNHLRILSGLYGLVRPLDLIQPYRLMMGTPFAPDAKHKNLYSFWGEKPTRMLDQELHDKGVLVNLASGEYFKALRPALLNRRVVTCEFKENKAGKYSIVSTFAKLARGYMAGFIVRNGIEKVEDLKAFDTQGYRFDSKLSSENDWVFVR